MSKSIRVFKSFEEQEMFFLKYFADLTPSGRLQALAKLQKQNHKYSDIKPTKKITVLKHFLYGY